MITVKIYLQNYKINGFEISGHALWGPEGEDIVCAAVSMVSQTALLGLSEFLHLKLEGKVEKGLIRCFLPSGLTDEEKLQANAILETMLLGVKQVAKDYPAMIKVVKEEVAS